MQAPAAPFPQPSDPAIHTNGVYVVYTSADETLEAARVAGDFAKPLGVPVTLTHFRAVPFAAPLEAPGGISPVQTEGFLNGLRKVASDVRVQVYHCRDVERAMQTAFGRPRLIVMGGRRRWWPTRPERWRRALEAQGHLVVFVGNPKAPAARARMRVFERRSGPREP